MTARLLAYGGTRFSERVRFGMWPEIAGGVLGDSYGLMPPAYSFGVGVLARTPFLIIRARLNMEVRGGYPYTLLIDPGEAVWNSYGWNAARMIYDLVSGPYMQQLLDSPEECTQDFVDNLFAGGEKTSLRKQTVSQELGRLLAGSLCRERPLIIAPSQLLLSERPDPQWMASVMNQLDPVFRIGGGWLVGGGSAHAKALGVNLILDEQGAASQVANEESPEAESRFMKAVEIIKSDPEIHAFFRPYLDMPAWQWPVEPAQMEQAISLFADLLGRDEIEPAMYRKIRSYPANDPFAEPLKKAARKAALRSKGKIPEEGAVLILEAALASEIELRSQDGARMGDEFLLAELSKRGYPSRPLPSSMHLPPGILTALWKKFLSETAENRPGLLEKALEQMPELEEAEVASLVEAAFPKPPRELRPWSRMANHPRAGSYVRERLKKEVRRALQEKSPSFDPQTYLLFAEDDGMQELAQELEKTAYPGERASACLNAWLEMRGTEHRAMVEQCLLRLASSPFRSLIPLRLKRQIVTEIGAAGQTSGPWARFQALETLYMGGKAKCPGSPSPEEAQFLNLELEEFFKGDNGEQVPLLSGLKKCVGDFSEPVLQRLRAYRPSPQDRQKRGKWKEELDSAGLKEDAERETLALMRDFPNSRASLENVSEEALRKFINELFFADRPPQAGRDLRKEISNFFSQAGNSERVRKIVGEQLRTPKRPEVAQRWLENRAIPEKLLELFPEEREGIMAVLAKSRMEFLRAFLPDLTRATGKRERISGLPLEAARYLMDNPERARDAHRFLGNRLKHFLEDLQDLIMRSTER
jgi:hypothetical protein